MALNASKVSKGGVQSLGGMPALPDPISGAL